MISRLTSGLPLVRVMAIVFYRKLSIFAIKATNLLKALFNKVLKQLDTIRLAF